MALITLQKMTNFLISCKSISGYYCWALITNHLVIITYRLTVVFYSSRGCGGNLFQICSLLVHF